MAIDLTSQWGAAQWGAAQWGGEEEEASSSQDIVLAGIAGPTGVGSLALSYTQSISFTGIAPSSVCGTPTVIGGDQFITFIGISTQSRLGVPNVAGPITFEGFGIASGATPGTPGVFLQQVISVTGIPSGAITGPITAQNVLNVYVGGIASTAAAGTPTVQGGTQFVQFQGFSSSRVGTPTIAGGALKGRRLFVGGVDRSGFLKFDPEPSFSFQTKARASCSFVMRSLDALYAPALGQTVQFFDFGRRIFMGCLSEVTVTRALGTKRYLEFQCQALDKGSILDHRVVTGYTFAKGTDGADAIRYLVTNYLDGEGILTDTIPATLGPLPADVPANFITCSNAMDDLTTALGCTWWVDVDGQLRAPLFDALETCPFQFTDTSRNYSKHSARYSLDNYRNIEYVRSNLNAVPGDGSAAGFSVDFSYVVPQAEAVARQFYIGNCVLPTPAASITSLKVNGVETPVYSGLITPGIPHVDWAEVWWMFFNTPYLNAPGSSSTGGGVPPVPGDLIEISYIPTVQSTSVVIASKFSPAAYPGLGPGPGESFGTCGSGKFEVVDQVDDIVVTDDLQAIADATLARKGVPPVAFSTETFQPGASIGQKLHIDQPKLFLPNTDLIITSMQGTMKAADLTVDRKELRTDGRPSSILWTISASKLSDLADWLKFFQVMIRRTEHANPIDRQEDATFALEPGGSLSSGLYAGNPYKIKRSGRLNEAYAIAGNPSTDQDLLLDVLASDLGNVSIFSTPIVVPAMSIALVKAVAFYSNPGYVFKDGILRPLVNYNVIGPNPTKASSVTLGVSWVW